MIENKIAKTIQMFATDEWGNYEEITDLYWFEEHYVHGLEQSHYEFEMFVDGVKVYPKIVE